MLSTNESSKETKRLGYGPGFSFVYNDLFYNKLNSGVSISYYFDSQDNPQGYDANIYLIEAINRYVFLHLQSMDLYFYGGLNLGLIFNNSSFDPNHIPASGISAPNSSNNKSSGVGVSFAPSLGLDYQITSRFNLNLEVSSHFTSNDRINPWLDDLGDGFWRSKIGLKYRLSQNVDSLAAYDELYLRIGEPQVVDIKFKRLSIAFDNADFGLKSILKTLFENPDWMIEIQGHMSNAGNPDNITRLSSSRANKIKEWLILNGVDPIRLEAKGFGKTVPIYPNDTKKIEQKMKEFLLFELSKKTHQNNNNPCFRF
jgi:hypothetical protein